MQIQVIDFPSDIYGETYKLREEMTKCLQRAATSDTGAAVLSEVIKFSIGKLKQANAERAASKVVEPVVVPDATPPTE